jgi:glycosyltransferase involved in cell wall biosynthesis
MRILLLAPEPFYQERGTPIAIDRLLGVLAERGEHVDMVTYHEGSDVQRANLKIHRIPGLPGVRDIRPGLSWQKVVCDVLLFAKALRLASRHRYDLVHAVEESVFIALVLKTLFGTPYVYDMDSSLSQQVVERYPRLGPLAPLMEFWEKVAVRRAVAVVPVCEALAEIVQHYYYRGKVVVLHDPSLLQDAGPAVAEDLRRVLEAHGPLAMYVGNLKPYQGVDLLLASFALAANELPEARLVILGGNDADIRHYEEVARNLAIGDRVHLVGPKPVELLGAYLAQADVLVSPRIQGNNTPMKVYSYLDSGKAVLATDLPTHTQVLDGTVALLAKPEPRYFGRALASMLRDRELRDSLGLAGRRLAAEKYSATAFHRQVNDLYDWLRAAKATRGGVGRRGSLPS